MSLSKQDRVLLLRQLNWVSVGVYYGYPTCCIAEFVRERTASLQRGIRPTPRTRLFDDQGTGFKACGHCTDTKSEAELRNEIAAERFSRVPFPSDASIKISADYRDFERRTGVYLARTAHWMELTRFIDGLREYHHSLPLLSEST